MEIDAGELIKQLKEDIKDKEYVDAEIIAFRSEEGAGNVQVLSSYDFDDKKEELATDVHLSAIKALYELAVKREEALLKAIEIEDENLRDLIESDLKEFKENVLKGDTEDE